MMKCKAILLLLMVPILLISCGDDKSSELSPKIQLIEKLLDNSEVPRYSGKVIVLKTEFCNAIDCVNYFKDYVDDIQVFSKADVFMAGITNYVEIENMDEENGTIVLRKPSGKEFERIEIRI